MADSSGEVALAIERLDRALARVPEREMRAQLVLEALADRAAPEAYLLIAGILKRGARGGCAFDVLRDALHDLLLQPAGTSHQELDYQSRSALFGEAHEAGDEEVMRLLRKFAPRQGSPRRSGAVPRRLVDVPLGRRRSLARGTDIQLLEELARDPDPVVVGNLLGNPRLCEEHVLRMAALRPVAESTLIEIHGSPRWSTRQRIRIALARNPYCPVDVAVKVLISLPGRELREIASDARLHAEVRAQAEAELLRREGEPV